jgi:hypothetical protein
MYTKDKQEKSAQKMGISQLSALSHGLAWNHATCNIKLEFGFEEYSAPTKSSLTAPLPTNCQPSCTHPPAYDE